MNNITLPAGSLIKIFSDENEAREYLKPYSSFYYDMIKLIRELQEYYLEEQIINNAKDKQEVFDKIMEKLNEVCEEYSELFNE